RTIGSPARAREQTDRVSAYHLPLKSKFPHSHSAARVFAVPLERDPHTFVERKLRSVPQFLDRCCNLGLRVADIRRARRAVLSRNLDTLDLLQQRPRFI